MLESEQTATRLNKRLVDLSLADSRRKADELIKQGRITVNGKLANLTTKVSTNDSIKLDNSLGKEKDSITIKINKPIGYISSHSSQGKGETIFSFLPKNFAKLKIAGRLDKQSCGLMILSSDGEIIQALSHPSKNKLKMYLVKLNKDLNDMQVNKLLDGIKLSDGLSKFLTIKKISSNTLRVGLGEGRNRQIRRTFEALGLKVVYLQRLQVGPIKLGNIKPKGYEFISKKEIEEIL